MKHVVPLFFLSLSLLIISPIKVCAQTLTQTFESGENTVPTWGSAWSGSGTITNTFLAASLGGQDAGIGLSTSQNFSRSFQRNTVGIGLTNQYYMSLYVEVDNYSAASGQLDIYDGSFGSPAAEVQVRSNGSGQLIWTAYNGSANSYQSFGINLNLSNPYYISFSINPASKSYSATITEVNPDGSPVAGQSATLTNVPSDPNVFGNSGNGILGVYLQASAGTAGVLVDDITISSMPISTTPTPEPATVVLVAGGLSAILYLKRLRRAD